MLSSYIIFPKNTPSMKELHLSIALILFQLPFSFSQNHFVSHDYSNYYEWFHERSQVEELYTDQSTLHVFIDQAAVHQKPFAQSKKITKLPAGFAIKNIAYSGYEMPEDQINGYGDIWYHVTGKDTQGKTFKGYIWGTHVAKSWKWVDLDKNGQQEFIMLGVSSTPRTSPRDIKAEIRILKKGKLVGQTIVPGLCLFEDCDSSPMLRILRDKSKGGMTVIEASTMSVSCLTGIEKTFFYWNGSNLELVFHGEFTTGEAFIKKSFVHNFVNKNQESSVILCEYSHENDRYNPVWDCKTVKVTPEQKTKPAVALHAADTPRAR